MIGKAACRGAATIVNAIATGRGAAFGVSLEIDALVNLEPGQGELEFSGSDEGRELAEACVRSIARRAGHAKGVHGEICVKSEIPISRGLKSSSAASNAISLASSRALDARLSSMELVLAGVEESIKAGVTVTGAFDDASACFLGGVIVTDNRTFSILSRGELDPDLEVLFHVPEKQIRKADVKKMDFSGIRKEIERAHDLALRGEYLKALELNSKAYAKILDVSEDIAHLARKNGALAAGISGTGPATTIICGRGETSAIAEAVKDHGGTILRTHVNDTSAEEVIPRLL